MAQPEVVTRRPPTRPAADGPPKHADAVVPHTGWRARVPAFFAALLGLVALLCALAALGGALGRNSQPVRQFVDDYLIPAPANLAYAAFLAVLAFATARRKKVAYWILLIYVSLALLADVLIGVLAVTVDETELVDDNGQPLITDGDLRQSIVGGVLLLARPQFYAQVRAGSVRRAIGVYLALAAIGIGLGFTLLTAFPGTLQTGSEKLLYAIEKVLGGSFAFDLTRAGVASGWVNLILGLFGAIAIFAALFTLLRSQQVASVLQPEEEAKIRGLLARSGDRDSLGYFATRRDKAVVFSHSGKSAITYRVVNGVSLASGDPLGDPEAWPAVIDEWLAQARRYAWTPAVMGAGEEGATAYDKAGLKVIHLGDEAILYPAEYTLEGRDMRPVRQAVHRVERAGYTAAVRRHADIPPPELAELARLAVAWRDTEGERGFSMALGRLGDPADGRCVLVEAKDSAGVTRSLLSFSPWGKTGLSLDLMRRDPEAENGAMEFMVSALMKDAGRLKVDKVSLNFAVFRAVFQEGARIGAGPILRLWRRLLVFFSRWWQLESLYRSNVKYQPHWTPRYLCFAERRELAKVGLASAVAEGFLVIPGSHAAGLDLTDVAAAPHALLASAEQDEAEDAAAAADGVPEQMRVRLAKLEALRADGVDPYPVGFVPADTCAGVRARHPELPADSATGERVSIAGRVVLQRDHGRLCFATVRDWSGDLQVMLSSDELPAGSVEQWLSRVDIGDQVGITGQVVTTRRGELSVLAQQWLITGKCLRPLPDKHSGLTDPEAKVRQRYLDLITNSDARDLLRARSAAVHSLRESLVGRDFIEVETPILQRIHGGANARPFTTHINAYDLRLYLRIAPELYLKRLAVGGVERVFELGRTFRNEGVSFKHNPEFTMLEAYQAYADYDTMLDLTRTMIQTAAVAANGSCVIRYSGAEHDVSGAWPVRTVNEAISAALGDEVTADSTVEQLRALCDRAGVPYEKSWGRGQVVLEMYERLVEEKTKLPTFYKDFPTDVSPLTREHRRDPRLAERWDLVAFGTELGTAYSELTDPVEQRRRLTAQSLLAADGDPRRWSSTRTFCRRSSSRCRRPVGWASGSTGW